MLGICDLGHSGRNWPAQGRPCVCLLAMQRSAANSLPPPPLSMGESKREPGCVGDTKRRNMGRRGRRGKRWAGVRVRELWEGRIDRQTDGQSGGEGKRNGL